MAIYLDNLVGLNIATVDLSEYITAITLTQTFDEVETTTMGDTSHDFAKGLEASTLQVDFLNDWAAAKVQATLQAAYGTSVTALIVPVRAASGTTIDAANPLYTVSILVNNLTPVGTGGPGDYATSSMTFTCTSSVAYATTGTFN
tara:strand:+ start:443 stop:877 length:435 start_codon:yes stop_codon:yes gene_type:complete